MFYCFINYIFIIFSCALSSGSLACFDFDGKLNINSLTKTSKDRLSIEISGDQIKAIPGSPIPAFIVTNKNVDKLIYIKENKVYTRSLTTKASSFIYTYMADRYILLQVFSPSQVCIIYSEMNNLSITYQYKLNKYYLINYNCI